MALKADRHIISEELRFYLNETADKGVVVTYKTVGSGVAMDPVDNVATVAATTSGARPIGVLLTEFVDIDLTRFPTNWHKDQANKGDKAAIVTKGWVVTDKVVGSPNAGDIALLTSSGAVYGIAPGTAYNQATNPPVGRFRTKKDQNGFATLFVDL